MDKPHNENLSELKVSKDEIIENVAEKILNQERSVGVIDKNNHQIGIFDCSPDFYQRGADKVQQAAEQYKLFYQNPDFDPNNYFINKTL